MQKIHYLDENRFQETLERLTDPQWKSTSGAIIVVGKDTHGVGHVCVQIADGTNLVIVENIDIGEEKVERGS